MTETVVGPVSEPTYPIPPFSFNGILAAEIVIAAYAYWFASRRIAPLRLPAGTPVATRSQITRFAAGLAVLWVSASWPVHDIGEQYLFSFHMTEHMIIGFIAAPLILSGIPSWLADWLVQGRALTVARWLCHPAPAFGFFTAALFIVHVPAVVTVQITSELAHGGIHVVYLATAFLAWMPVVSPHPLLPPLSPPQRMAYLLAHSILPTIPASLLTFSTVNLYPSYGDASFAWGLDPVTDQNIAGLIMKLGGGLLLWGRIIIIWFQWANRERSADLETQR